MPRPSITRKKYLKTLTKKPVKTLKWKPNIGTILNTANTYPTAGNNWNHWRKIVPRRRNALPTAHWITEFSKRGSLKNYNRSLTRSKARVFRNRNTIAHYRALLLRRHLDNGIPEGEITEMGTSHQEGTQDP